MKITGRQLTVMVVAVCAAAVLTPTAVYAVTGNAVNVTDPYNASQKARVSGGKLTVGDGVGALTVDGTVRVGDGSGALTVDGTTVSADPSTAWSVYADIANNGTDILLLKDLAANAGATIGSITLSNTAASVVKVQLMARHPNSANVCTGPGVVQDYYQLYAVPANDTRTIAFSPRLRVPKLGAESCLFLYVTGSGTDTVSITATGATY
jgi:hypothetical protein